MQLKFFVRGLSFLILFLGLTALSAKPTLASQKPSQEITMSEEVYADLALRHSLNHVSVYYFDGNPANTVSLNAQKKWYAASTIKLYAAMYAYDQVEKGKIRLDQEVLIDGNNATDSRSDPKGYPALLQGQTVTIFRLIDQMITQSDNTAFNVLVDLLDRREITKYIHDLGLVNSNVGGKLNLNGSQLRKEVATPGFGEIETTAEDYAKAFILINAGKIPGSADLFNILSRQKLNSMIPALLPSGVTVAHKTGELSPYYHDGGIIIAGNKRYILSIFSDSGGPSVIAHISKLIYTKDLNLIGSEIQKIIGEEQRSPNTSAETAQNISTPSINGVNTEITSNPFDLKELPKIIFPIGSPLHFLVDLGDKITTSLIPIPSLKTAFEIGNLKLKLAEASDLVAKGKKEEAHTILNEIDTRLPVIASQSLISQNQDLQISIIRVSETRFSILKDELSSLSQNEKIAAIKEIARQAEKTVNSVVPYIGDVIKSQKPPE